MLAHLVITTPFSTLIPKENLMKYQFTSYVRTHALLLALLILTFPEAFASNMTPDQGGTSAPAPQNQLRPRGTCDPQMKLIDGVCRPPVKNLTLKQSIVVQP